MFYQKIPWTFKKWGRGGKPTRKNNKNHRIGGREVEESGGREKGGRRQEVAGG